MFNGFKKFTLSIILLSVTLSSLVGFVISAKPANAQAVVAVASSIPDQIKDILSQIWNALKVAVLQAVIKVVSYGMRKIAYDSAVWLASGGKGQTPFTNTKGFGDYIKNVGDQAFGQAIESLSNNLTRGKINLCTIPDIKKDLGLKIGWRGLLPDNIANSADPTRESTCTLTQFADSWFSGDVWKSKFVGGVENITSQFNKAIADPGQSEFGLQLAGETYLNKAVLTKVAGEQLERLEGQGYSRKSNLAGDTQTSAATIRKEDTANTPSDQQAKDEAQINSLLTAGDIKVIPTILTIFLSNLGSTIVKNFQEKGQLPFGICLGGMGGDICKEQGSQAAGSYDSAGVLGGRAAAQQLFSDLLTVAVNPAENYDILGTLENCPENPELYNCRADSDLVQAVKRADTGEPLTIRQAMDPKENKLHGNWKLIPPSRAAENMDKNFCATAYCYNNIKVLRQLRILPLGFEIAAKLSNPDNPWTLKQVVDGFNDCDRDKQGRVIYNPTNKPFCHLIDPDWVLRAFPTRCDAYAPGSMPLAQGVPDRISECSDLKSCVSVNADGSCADYAYCAREKNVWGFTKDLKCSEQFATCRTFTDSAGKTASYLYRTLDTGFCNANNIGCAYYSLNKSSKGNWLSPSENKDTDWSPAGQQSKAGGNNGIFFNNKLTQSCSANSGGCSAFQVADAVSNLLYLRQAPSYLKCYDSDPATSEINWPQTLADINKLPATKECKSYAGACTPEEVGCATYKPTRGNGVDVPGKATGENVCDAKCVGYDSYREVPSAYSLGQDLAYIIPSSGQTCPQEAAGCTAFTNLSEKGGAEQVNYFTYLRPCVSDTKDKGVSFVTYEGTVSGYQLKTYQLVANAIDEFPMPQQGFYQPKGAPKYFYKTEADLVEYVNSCNESIYKNGTNLDCRQFNDGQGKIYYRLLSKTIPVSSQCTPYRLNNTELYTLPKSVNQDDCAAKYKGFWDTTKPAGQECQVCFQNGTYSKGQCFYDGLPDGVKTSVGSSKVCSVNNNMCREYKGNAGNKIKEIIPTQLFEGSASTSLAGWSFGVFWSPESANLGGHSLGYRGTDPLTKNVKLNLGESYILTFWAKGGGGGKAVNVSISLAEPVGSNVEIFSQPIGDVSIGDTWQQYTLGPVRFVDPKNLLETTNIQLSFDNASDGLIYIDNLRLIESSDQLFLRKDTLHVNPICDSNLNDNLPGEALGCKEYESIEQKQKVNLTGFDFICRAEAIGCTKVLATYNTLSAGGGEPQVLPDNKDERLYQVFLPGDANSIVSLKLPTGSTVQCSIAKGQNGCYVSTPILGISLTDFVKLTMDNGRNPQITVSTVYVPKDTSTSTPIYLINKPETTCNPVDVGCVDVGRMRLTPVGEVYETTTIKNDPANYQNILCQEEALGCKAYSGGSGNAYFKDPIETGQKICTYVEASVNSQSSGWFWKGVGKCINKKGGISSNKYCGSNNDCAGAPDNTCEDIGKQPCYSNYVTGDGSFGLWSYGNTGKYDNFVGECPANQNMCTHYIDHNDNDTSYYLFKNKVSASDCNGQVSIKKGCALFDEVDNPNKFYSTTSTYEQSSAVEGALVPAPQTNNPINDANVILKVNRNRECGEWLQCRSSHRVWDVANNRWKNVCDDIGRCSRLFLNDDKKNDAVCAEWVDDKHDYAGNKLAKDLYVARETKWIDMDYSGYSILDMYPLEELSQVNFSKDKESIPDWRLAKAIPCAVASDQNGDCAPGAKPLVDVACQKGKVFCGQNDAGKCINGICVEKLADNFGQSCRAYPEKDSPFPIVKTIKADSSQSSQNFSGVKVCDEGNGVAGSTAQAFACDCSYTKVTYGSFSKYWNYDNPNSFDPLPRSKAGRVPSGICQGGSQDGKACSNDFDCFKGNSPTPDSNGFVVTDGTCQKKANETKFQGWKGFCVEYDNSRILNGDQTAHPCLTWLPIDNLKGSSDINSQHKSAAFSGDLQYCIKANLFKKTAKGIIPYSGNINDPFSGDQENATGYFVGCQEFAVVDSNSKAWTDRLLGQTSKNAFYITNNVGPIAFATNTQQITYNFLTPYKFFGTSADPFTLTNTRVPPIMTSNWCEFTDELKKIRGVFSVGGYGRVCQGVFSKQYPQDGNKVPYTENVPYNSFGFDIDLNNNTLKTVRALESKKTGAARLSQIFAKVDSFLSWNGSQYIFNSNSPFTSPWDLTETGIIDGYNAAVSVNQNNYITQANNSPVIRAVENCTLVNDDLEQCAEGAADRVTVNNSSQGDVLLKGQFTNVFLKFFASADKDHMPLVQMKVDWGDSSQTEVNGKFLNHKGLVRSTCNNGKFAQYGLFKNCTDLSGAKIINNNLVGEIVAVTNESGTLKSCETDLDCPYIPSCKSKDSPIVDFGNKLGDSCDNNYYQFFHPYQCHKGGLGYHAAGEIDNSTGKPWCPGELANGCCVFVPKVQVKDNWGWYNGQCATPPGGLGCYDASYKNDFDEGAAVDGGAWAKYNGKIVISPN